MIHIVERIQCGYYIFMRFEFFQQFRIDADTDGIDTQTGLEIRRVEFDIIDLHAQFPDRGNKVLQVMGIGEFQMDFKVIGSVLEGLLQGWHEKHAHHRA